METKGQPVPAKQLYSYANLCKEQFRVTNAPPQFSRKDPRTPLLKSTPEEELHIILQIWHTVLRFMADTADNRHSSKSSKSRRQKTVYPPVMPRLRQEISKMTSSQGAKTSSTTAAASAAATAVPDGSAGEQQLVVGGSTNSGSGSTGSSKLKTSLKKRLSLQLLADQPQDLTLDEIVQTNFDQMQFVIGFGILRPDLRDEIYCMMLRQLTNNTQKTGRARLWVLLHLMIGIYPPSDIILPYVTRYIEDGPSANSGTIRKLLVRIQQNGPRFQPPSLIEYQAVLNKQPIDLQVTLMDGTNHSIPSDACTTSAEIIRAVAEGIELEQTFGFSLFISMENKISSLGSTEDKVFDSISHCEQVHRTNQAETGNRQEGDAVWRLFIRKEMFSPWDDITGYPVSTNLVYSQIVRGIMLGEYVCERDNDLAAVAAMQYYVEFECDVTEDNLYSALPYYVPSHKLTGEDSVRIWTKQVAKFLRKMITAYTKSDENYGRSPDDVRAELVTWAKRKWPKCFSRYYDVTRLEGPRWGSDSIILGVNSNGISLSTAKGDMGLDATYPQIASVMAENHDPSLKSISGSIIIFVFADGTLIKFDSTDSNDIYRLITSNMSGLLERSTWAVAKQQFHDPSGDYLSCIEGDLIQLKLPAKEEAITATDCESTNMATKEEGQLPTNLLHVLPCVDQPNDDILRLFRSPNYYVKRSVETQQHSTVQEDDEAEEEDDDEEGKERAVVYMEREAEDGGGSELNFESSDCSKSQEDAEFDKGLTVESRKRNTCDGEVEETKERTNGEKRDKEGDLNDISESELSSIGFDKEFFAAMNLFQKDAAADNEDLKRAPTPAAEPGDFSYV